MDAVVFSVINRTLIAGTPLLLGTLGEIVAERSGVLNLGVEGMMAVGAVSAFAVTLATGSPWMGLLVAAVAGMAASALHAFVSVTLRGSQVVSGLALTMLGLGAAGLFGKPFIGRPLPQKMLPVHIPLLGDIPVVGRLLFHQDPVFYIAVVVGVGLWFLLARTRWGIEVRSVGENPAAAAVQGISVQRVRYLGVLIGGALAGMAGAHLSLVYTKSWTEGLTGGRGWIVIALTIFALWNPPRAFLGAFLFGCIFVLQYLLQPLGIPPNLLGMMPYLATLAVLLLGSLHREGRRSRAPASLGEPFTPGER
ncbi:MAG: ABC transporter permease [Spirochaetales bacterium]|nr:ABC transporter permease [Spirochaetales bacterium]